MDHIVPEALFSRIAPNPSDFRKAWNLQPMHPECNNRKANKIEGRSLTDFEKAVTTGVSRVPDDWPRFECKCHYLQILDGKLCVCTTGIVGDGEHVLYEDVVREYDGVRQDAILVIGEWKEGESNAIGWQQKGKDNYGYLLSSYNPKRVPGFNISERARVGIATPKYIHVDERGIVTPVLAP